MQLRYIKNTQPVEWSRLSIDSHIDVLDLHTSPTGRMSLIVCDSSNTGWLKDRLTQVQRSGTGNSLPSRTGQQYLTIVSATPIESLLPALVNAYLRVQIYCGKNQVGCLGSSMSNLGTNHQNSDLFYIFSGLAASVIISVILVLLRSRNQLDI